MFVLCSFDLKFFVTYEYPGKKSKQNYKVITVRTFEIPRFKPSSEMPC